MRNKLESLAKVGTVPDYMVLHCGGNDIGKHALKSLRIVIFELFQFITRKFPQTKVIWSQILPRSQWRYSSDSIAMNRCRNRLNNFAAHKIVQSGGCYVRHPSLEIVTTSLYKTDGVHLSSVGNELFLNQLSAGIEAFVVHNVNLLP